MIKFFKRLFGMPKRIIARQLQSQPKTPEENRKQVGRILFYLAIGLFTLFIVRLAWIVSTDTVAGTKLAPLARANYKETNVIYAKRGTIFDRHGLPIAIDSSDYTIYIILDDQYVDSKGQRLYAKSSDFAKIASLFKAKLDMDEDYTLSQLEQKDRSQVEFGAKGTHISYQEKEAIEQEAQSMGIKGVGFYANLARSYLNGAFAANFIGTATLKDAGDAKKGLIGTSGIEASMDAILSGTNGVETYEKDKYGRPLPGAVKSGKKAKDGEDVYTTLEADLQSYLEGLVDTAFASSGAQELTATLVKANTGEILATTQRPSFNPQTKEGMDGSWSNLLYQSNYEPGSTMKVFTLASAIDTGNFDPNGTYTSGTLKVADSEVHDWDFQDNPYGHTLSFAQGFSFSSNIGMSLLQEKMGNELWDEYLSRFRFGVRTRIGFGGESTGQLPDDNQVSQVQSSFGQGISVTALQMLRGFTAITNSGTMLEPHFISKIVNTDTGAVRYQNREIIGKPVAADSADQVLQYMVNVGTDPVFGTAYNGAKYESYFMLDGNPLPVKTGTAQIARKTGGYIDDTPTSYLYSAITMSSSEHPDFMFYMTVKLPNNWSLKYIADVANPLFARAQSLGSAIDVPPVEGASAEKITVTNFKDKLAGESLDQLRRELIMPVVVGKGNKVVDQSIEPDKKINAGRRLLLLSDGKAYMPDVYAWSKEELDCLAKWYDLSITYKGEGKQAISQSISMNTQLKKGQKLTIKLGEAN